MFNNPNMINNIPKIQDFIWIGEFSNGTHLSEFDLETLKENSFYDIDRENLIRFGLAGHEMTFYFEKDGTFKLAGRMIEILYKIDDKEYYLTGQPHIKYNDIITYKDAECFINPMDGHGTSASQITQFNLGYKTNIDIDDIHFNFKPVFKIPMEKPIYLSIWLVSDKDLDGYILIKRNGKIVEEIYAPMKKDVGGELNWEVK